MDTAVAEATAWTYTTDPKAPPALAEPETLTGLSRVNRRHSIFLLTGDRLILYPG